MEVIQVIVESNIAELGNLLKSSGVIRTNEEPVTEEEVNDYFSRQLTKLKH